MTDLPDDLRQVRADDLAGQYRELYRRFVAYGLDGPTALRAVLIICDSYAGTSLYVPVRRAAARPARDRAIADNYRGDVRRAAVESGCNETTIRRIIRHQQQLDF